MYKCGASYLTSEDASTASGQHAPLSPSQAPNPETLHQSGTAALEGRDHSMTAHAAQGQLLGLRASRSIQSPLAVPELSSSTLFLHELLCEGGAA